MEKAWKAYFKIKKTVSLNNPARLIEKLFDCLTLISPILLYCSEIRGAFYSLKDSDPFENLHLKFIKETLGVNCKASNDACRAELARLPLRNLIHASCINFLDYILSSDNTLIYQIYNATKTSNPWIKKTKYLLDSLGYSYIFDNNVNFKHQLINIKQRIKDQNLQNQIAIFVNLLN
jgi:hypothetical protein